MKKKTIPTVIGLLLLILSLAFGVGLISYRQFFRLGAAGEVAPKNVRISNLSDLTFTVSWTTDKAALGFVKYGESQGSLTKIEKEQNPEENLTHLVKITGLNPETVYFFKINSGGEDFDNNGLVWQVQTGPQIASPSQNLIASGNILTPSGQPAKNVLVYISVGGSLLSTLTSGNGSWLIPISAARNPELNDSAAIDPASSVLEIIVQGGLGEIASAQIFPQSANPVPTIILGQVYDFKSLSPPAGSDVPQASLEAPLQQEPVSGFNLPNQPTTTAAKAVTLESIDEGEVVSSTKPEFFGQGPTATAITITIESDPITENLTIPQSGEWKWATPTNLSPGTHKITLSWKDVSGITRTLSRTFIVQAAERPAFEATPSATFTPTPMATPTLPPQPQSGSLTATLALFIMGIGTILFSLVIWQKAEI